LEENEMATDNGNESQPQQVNLPPARLPEGHQPVNTEVLVRGAGQQGVETKIIRGGKAK